MVVLKSCVIENVIFDWVRCETLYNLYTFYKFCLMIFRCIGLSEQNCLPHLLYQRLRICSNAERNLFFFKATNLFIVYPIPSCMTNRGVPINQIIGIHLHALQF